MHQQILHKLQENKPQDFEVNYIVIAMRLFREVLLDHADSLFNLQSLLVIIYLSRLEELFQNKLRVVFDFFFFIKLRWTKKELTLST